MPVGDHNGSLHMKPEAARCYSMTCFLAGLGKQAAFMSTGYSLDVEWQPSYVSHWESLGCLESLVSLKLTGLLPDLPVAWAQNSSFPLLQVRL